MTRLEALVGLNLVPEIGSTRLAGLFRFFKDPEDILKAAPQDLVSVCGISGKIAAKICGLKKEDIEKEFRLADKYGLRIITQEDPEYPVNLKNIPGPPIVLYVKGEFKEDDRLGIAIVGSRRASFYGLSNAQKFAAELSREKFTVVSGMARGIDTYAHQGALSQSGRTIAVMGSGFRHIYPAENRKLAEKISKNGAVISEFPIDTPPRKENFPRRNRIISGLSLGVLVVEAARNSGALITVDFALEQGREVFALPGKVDSDTSFGTNELIKQGAKLVSSVPDILEEFILLHCGVCRDKNEAGLGSGADLADSGEEGVYNLISPESVHLDELLEKTNLDIPRISGILLRLQMKRLIKQLPGKQFVRSQA